PGGGPVRSRRQADQRRPHRETSAHRIEGEADPLLVVTDGGEAQPSEPDRGPWVSLRRVAAQSAWRAEGAGPARAAPEGCSSRATVSMSIQSVTGRFRTRRMRVRILLDA